MTSNGSVIGLILITNDQYFFLKNQPQNEINCLDYRKKTTNPRSSTHISRISLLLRKKNEEVTNRTIDTEQTLIAQINLNSRFQDEKKSNEQTSAPQENNTPEKILGSLLQSGIAGGKNERSRQILKAVQKNRQNQH